MLSSMVYGLIFVGFVEGLKRLVLAPTGVSRFHRVVIGVGFGTSIVIGIGLVVGVACLLDRASFGWRKFRTKADQDSPAPP